MEFVLESHLFYFFDFWHAYRLFCWACRHKCLSLDLQSAMTRGGGRDRLAQYFLYKQFQCKGNNMALILMYDQFGNRQTCLNIHSVHDNSHMKLDTQRGFPPSGDFPSSPPTRWYQLSSQAFKWKCLLWLLSQIDKNICHQIDFFFNGQVVPWHTLYLSLNTNKSRLNWRGFKIFRCSCEGKSEVAILDAWPRDI